MRQFDLLKERIKPITSSEIENLEKDSFFSGRKIKEGDKVIKGVLTDSIKEDVLTGITFHPDEVSEGLYKVIKVKILNTGTTPYLLYVGNLSTIDSFFSNARRMIEDNDLR